MRHLSKTANRITSSQRKRINETEEERAFHRRLLPPEVTLQDDVKRFTPNGAEFIDGSCEDFDAVIFATGNTNCHIIGLKIMFEMHDFFHSGYNYSFPFLTVDSDIYVDSGFVQTLPTHFQHRTSNDGFLWHNN